MNGYAWFAADATPGVAKLSLVWKVACGTKVGLQNVSGAPTCGFSTGNLNAVIQEGCRRAHGLGESDSGVPVRDIQPGSEYVDAYGP
jgi:hypothetical protein